MHPQVMDWLAGHAAGLQDVRRVLEIGSRDLQNGEMPMPRSLWPDAEWLGVDLRSGPGVDVVLDASSPGMMAALIEHMRRIPQDRVILPPVDLVICCEVLEHAERPDAIVANTWYALRPGGTLLVTCATDPRGEHSGITLSTILAPGEHYRNIPPSELRQWLEPFCDVIVEDWSVRGDLYASARRPA